MPRVATDYSKTVIYCFVCQDKTITCSYVGSTTDIVKRKCCHKSRCHNQTDKRYNYSLYQTIRDNGGWTNWTIMPLEEFACENSTQQKIREQYWIDKLNPVLNCIKANRTDEEVVIYHQQYRDTHKEEIKERDMKYREAHKEELKLKKKKYYEAHKEERLLYKREWYKRKHSSKIDGDASEPIHSN